jgi:hypothetical protein
MKKIKTILDSTILELRSGSLVRCVYMIWLLWQENEYRPGTRAYSGDWK